MSALMSHEKLAMDVRGEGETIVLLHGWGMHSGIWQDLAASLSEQFRVVCIDLPGHGHSAAGCPLTLDAVVAQMLSQVDGVAHWLGWSLGASIMMRLLARAPERVKSVVLLSASPAFVSQPGWLHGINASVLSRFAQELQDDYKKTLQRFLALQTLSSDAAKVTLKQLRDSLFDRSAPDSKTLQQGLDILMHADLRDDIAASQKPCLVVLGQHDQLVPVSVAEFYHALTCRPQVAVIDGAGHAPFLSHPMQTLEQIVPFIKANSGIDDNE
jgi:pimeloyl-[acyl-carrier protein] methyl ester esterase